MAYKIKLQELFKKIKACATAGVSLHIGSFLSDSSVTVLINIDFIFEIIFCSAPRLIVAAEDKILTHCDCLYTIQQDDNLLIILVFIWGPKKKS